jgi:acetylornithine deacetylase/succinyl-diaminopimelate desuccinylase-like protein
MSEKSYKILEEFCTNKDWKNESNSIVGTKEPTVRVNKICDVLDKEGIEYDVDKFEDTRYNNGSFYHNIEVRFKAKEETDETIVFTAHHDVVVPSGENCQDNTSSVVNLIELCFRISLKDLERNVYIVFTDCEEFGGLGAKRLSDRINNGILKM